MRRDEARRDEARPCENRNHNPLSLSLSLFACGRGGAFQSACGPALPSEKKKKSTQSPPAPSSSDRCFSPSPSSPIFSPSHFPFFLPPVPRFSSSTSSALHPLHHHSSTTTSTRRPLTLVHHHIAPNGSEDIHKVSHSIPFIIMADTMPRYANEALYFVPKKKVLKTPIYTCPVSLVCEPKRALAWPLLPSLGRTLAAFGRPWPP